MIQQTLYYKTVSSPVGPLRLVASEKGLSAVLFHDGCGSRRAFGAMEESDQHPLLRVVEKQLAEYFSGKRRAFDLPLDMQGTVFQIKAWRQLQKIPYGETISYGEQAKRLGDAKKARAAGMANGRNPLAIIVPCHRVIGASGDLTGFGGGLKTKQQLLELERRYAANTAKAA
ncbi:MAG: methylated-DNA--[protein]-cysteine S-methyltransferase [Pseudomonadota bacterium]|nr:methylated-DNA--[protein]-cysteine S-methyltransferase [Pseudomonadota bacterium]